MCERLAAGPSASASMSAVLPKDIFPLVLRHMNSSETGRLRAVSRDFLQACDAEIASLKFADYKEDEDEWMPHDVLLRWARGQLSRGCRPLAVVASLAYGSLTQRRASIAGLLESITSQAESLGEARLPMPTTKLTINADLLSPAIARAASAAFPALTHLCLDDINADMLASSTGRYLSKLLRGEVPDDSAADGRLLPGLVSLELRSADVHRVPESLALAGCTFLQELRLRGFSRLGPRLPAHLGSMTRLRSLDLGGVLPRKALLKQLRGLTQLQSLRLDNSVRVAAHLGPVLGALTALTSLYLLDGYGDADSDDDVGDPSLPGEYLTRLTSLRELHVPSYQLLLPAPDGGLTELGALTSLVAYELMLPGDIVGGPVVEEPFTAATLRVWQLPPQLCKLQLLSSTHQIAVLAGLQLPSSLTELQLGCGDGSGKLELQLDGSWFGQGEGPLRPASRAALHAVMRLLRRASADLRGAPITALTIRSLADIDIFTDMDTGTEDMDVLPTDMTAAAKPDDGGGGGTADATAGSSTAPCNGTFTVQRSGGNNWMAELGRLRLNKLDLDSLGLWDQDLSDFAAHSVTKVLHLERCTFPVGGLAKLAGCTSLTFLRVDFDRQWFDVPDVSTDDDSSELSEADGSGMEVDLEEAEEALFVLCASSQQRRVVLHMSCPTDTKRAAGEALVQRVKDRLRAAGLSRPDALLAFQATGRRVISRHRELVIIN